METSVPVRLTAVGFVVAVLLAVVAFYLDAHSKNVSVDWQGAFNVLMLVLWPASFLLMLSEDTAPMIGNFLILAAAVLLNCLWYAFLGKLFCLDSSEEICLTVAGELSTLNPPV